MGGILLGAAVRPLVLVLALLAASSSVLAQGANETNETTVNETAPTNETATNESAPSEPPAVAGPIEITLEGVQDGSALFFRDASGARNPTLTVQPGQRVTFKFNSVAGVHNLNLGGLAKSALVSDGESTELTWTAPAEPTKLEYWCDPHKSAGMKGTINVGAAAAPEEGAEEGAITGDTVDLGHYSAACAGKVAPAIVTTGITGAPTLDDYVKRCEPTTAGSGERAKHVVDYVIPLSWLLIGLGIVGVVWVHKYYKP